MEWVETIAKTVDEAKGLALDQLGVDEGDAEFEIVEEPKPGLFGRMRGEARVRARVRPSKPRPKAEHRRRRDGEKKADKPTLERSPKAVTGGTGGSIGSVGELTDSGDVIAERTVQKKASRAATAGSDVTSAGQARPERVSRSARQEEKPVDTTEEPASEVDEGAAASEFLAGLAEALGVEATTTIVMHGPDDIEVRLDGGDLGLLIGPRGQTLSSVQELTRLAVQKNGERRGWLRIDIGGYREKRREALVRFTEQIVADVTSTSTPRALEPMSSADRKIVHDAATALGGVRTSSEGEDPHRRVVISPLGDA